MAEYIDKDAILRHLADVQFGEKTAQMWDGVEDAMQAVIHFPAADVVPVVHGKWEKCRESYCSWSCSVCKEIVIAMPERMGEPMYAYCPSCGAKMDEVNDG